MEATKQPTQPPSQSQVVEMKGITEVPSEIVQFEMFQEFLENSLDEFKEELSMLLFPIFKHIYLDMILLEKSKEGRKFFSKYKELFSKNPDKMKVIDTLDTVSKENLSSKLFSDLLEKRDRVAISNYSISILLHFLKIKRLQTIMNILNNKIEIKKITTIKVAKTNNTIISHLIDSGIDVDVINQSELKLQRLKLSQATRKHFSKSNEYMEIINAEIPIPNYVDFNLLLLDEDD